MGARLHNAANADRMGKFRSKQNNHRANSEPAFALLSFG